MNAICTLSIALAIAATTSKSQAASDPLSPPTVRDAIGINIHFTEPRPGEMDLLAGTGVGRVRMDIAWKKIETVKGIYDFSKFDKLMDALDAKRLSPILVMDYGNAIYSLSDKIAPVQPAARHAFAAWAAATVSHFAGRGILWELYNEPNNKEFWTPNPDGIAYAAVVNEACRAIHATAPGELVIGPAMALIDKPFLKKAIDAGILNDFAAVSVHPYRHTAPETFGIDLSALRDLVDVHAPAGKVIPIVAGEWGYPEVWVDHKTQVDYLAREMLFDLSQHVPLTIWYDWRRGGSFEGKHDIYGLVTATSDGRGGYDVAKTRLYEALSTLTRVFGETHFVERLRVDSPQDYILAFDGPAGRRYAAWTINKTPHGVAFLKNPADFESVDVAGAIQPMITNGGSREVFIFESPRYYIPK